MDEMVTKRVDMLAQAEARRGVATEEKKNGPQKSPARHAEANEEARRASERLQRLQKGCTPRLGMRCHM